MYLYMFEVTQNTSSQKIFSPSLFLHSRSFKRQTSKHCNNTLMFNKVNKCKISLQRCHRTQQEPVTTAAAREAAHMEPHELQVVVVDWTAARQESLAVDAGDQVGPFAGTWPWNGLEMWTIICNLLKIYFIQISNASSHPWAFQMGKTVPFPMAGL